MKPFLFISMLMASTAFANQADEYMQSYVCQPNQSFAACLFLAGSQATKEMNSVLKELSVCVDQNSTALVHNPKAKLLKEQAAFLKYADSLQSYLPQNSVHSAQNLHATRLLLVLERTDILKESLQFCKDNERFK